MELLSGHNPPRTLIVHPSRARDLTARTRIDGLAPATRYEYRIRADGSALITSAAEIAESEFEIDDQPDSDGFYRSNDKIVKDNGKKDCTGEITEIGHVIQSFIVFHPSNNMFLMCQRRDMGSCIGPFIRVRGTEI